MVRGSRGIWCVPPAWLIHCGFHGVLFIVLPRLLFNPLFFRTRPRLRSGLLPLASAGTRIILHRGNLLRAIPPIRKIFPSFVMPVVPVLIMARLACLRRFSLNRRLHWVSQCVAICHTYHLCQRCRHVPLQLLPQRRTSSAPIAKPSNGLCLYHSFTRVPCGVPPGQVIPVCFVRALHAQGELLRSVWPPVGTAEVAHESFLKVYPAVYASCRQVVKPNACRSYQEGWYNSYGPTPVSSACDGSSTASDVHRGNIIRKPIFRLSGAIVCFCVTGQLEVANRWFLFHDSWAKAFWARRTFCLDHLG